jgi:RNA polymerase-binding transcription factor DksA
MGDIVDIANENVEAARQRDLANHNKRTSTPQPEYNDNGDKVCIDCDTVIPKLRAAIVGVCRCIDCQKDEEKRIWVN